MCVEAFSVTREPRQSSMWYLVNGKPVFSKKRGQPIRSTQSDRRSQGLASALYTRRMFFTTAPTSGQRGALFGRPEATSLWKVGRIRALEFLPPTQIAILENSGSLICIGGQGGKQAPQHTHLASSTSREGLPGTRAGRIAATGQRATTVGRSQTL